MATRSSNAVGFGIGTHAQAVEALGLDIARRGDPRGDFGAAFGRRRQREVGGADAGDVDVEIDAVE